jgi:hypothetical protein
VGTIKSILGTYYFYIICKALLAFPIKGGEVIGKNYKPFCQFFGKVG